MPPISTPARKETLSLHYDPGALLMIPKLFLSGDRQAGQCLRVPRLLTGRAGVDPVDRWRRSYRRMPAPITASGDLFPAGNHHRWSQMVV